MQGAVEPDVQTTGGILGELIRQARLKYQNRLELQRLEQSLSEEKYFPGLCWSCARSTWGCLCNYPWESAPVDTIEGPEGLQVVEACEWYWPE